MAGVGAPGHRAAPRLARPPAGRRRGAPPSLLAGGADRRARRGDRYRGRGRADDADRPGQRDARAAGEHRPALLGRSRCLRQPRHREPGRWGHAGRVPRRARPGRGRRALVGRRHPHGRRLRERPPGGLAARRGRRVVAGVGHRVRRADRAPHLGRPWSGGVDRGRLRDRGRVGGAGGLLVRLTA